MPQVTRTDQAELDLIEILARLGGPTSRAAARFSAEVDRITQLLAQFPDMGTPCEDLGVGLRRFPVGKYVIFYRPTDGGIEVARVIYGRRNFPSLFFP
jgi:toxin ParE1/3/4